MGVVTVIDASPSKRRDKNKTLNMEIGFTRQSDINNSAFFRKDPLLISQFTSLVHYCV